MEGRESREFGEFEEILWNALGAFEKDLETFKITPLLKPESYKALVNLLLLHVPRVHEAFDLVCKSQIKSQSLEVFCGPKCSACCRHWVDSVEPFELIYLDLHLRQRDDYPGLQLAFNRREQAHIKSVQQEQFKHEDLKLYHYFLRDLPCPLLDKEGNCGIHKWRAMSCRMFFSASPAQFCVREATTSESNKNFLIELPEALEIRLAQVSLKFRRLDLPEGLFSGLLKVQEVFGHLGWPPDPYQDNL